MSAVKIRTGEEIKRRNRNWWAEAKKDPERKKVIYKNNRIAKARRKELLKLINPTVMGKVGTGVCAYRDCEQKLSIYNKTIFCARHFRVMFNKGLIKDKEIY